MTKNRLHHRILIIGGGTAGITVAARLRRAGQDDVAIIEPAAKHYYQPLWTLVGGGRAPLSASIRSETSVMPQGVAWIRDSAVSVDPDAAVVTTAAFGEVSYDYLVVCPGLQLDWGRLTGLDLTLGSNGVSSNYSPDFAPRTWELIQGMRSGTAVFTMPSGPIKCGGAPQKIAYLAADYWRMQGVLGDIRVILSLPSSSMFAVPEFSVVLEQVVKRYGIEVMFNSEAVEIDGPERRVVIANAENGSKSEVHYDMLHAVPPQSAPDWLKRTSLSDGSDLGWVQVDKDSLRHLRYPNIFALGDAANLPTSKTGAAVRKQAPVLVANLLSVMKGGGGDVAGYDGYTSCPLTTARNRMLLAEFDYDHRPDPSIPFINTRKERYDMWLLKRYGLPAMYWHLMLKGLV